ncbi:uncharacterized protein LOC134239826 [Saccostrea cucullata]|uniref:uncharacterized protein LOC134239826 n=1 Tax=Saccostrea cuccullata TaxID=36930 RepID=UPI002ED58522
MNTSNVSTDHHFMDLIQRERLARLPYGVIVLLCCLIGILGNSHVIHIFRRMPRKMTPSEAVIFNLALFDLITLVLFVAKEYERLRFVLYNRFEIICKITNYVGFTTGLASSLYVLVLSVYRHQRLYNPRSAQTTVTRIIIKLIACFIISAILSIPVPFVVGFQKFYVEDFQVNRCWIAEDQVIASLPEGYNIFLLALSCINCCIICVCNIRIAKVLHQSKLTIKNKVGASEMTTCNLAKTDITEHDVMKNVTEEKISKGENGKQNVDDVTSDSTSKKNKQEDGTAKSPSTTGTKGSNAIDVKDGGEDVSKTIAKDTEDVSNAIAKDVANSGDDVSKAIAKDVEDSGEDVSKAISFTITILLVTITIMISYILFLSLYMYVIYKRADPNFRIISVREDAFNTYATDIVCLNAVINPFVYFFSDRKYRIMIKSIYKRKQRIYDGSFRVKKF